MQRPALMLLNPERWFMGAAAWLSALTETWSGLAVILFGLERPPRYFSEFLGGRQFQLHWIPLA